MWTDAVFELAWQSIEGAPLSAPKYAWFESTQVALEGIESLRLGDLQLPEWFKIPPDCWYSMISNVFEASVAAIDILLPTTAEPGAADRDDWDWLIAEVCSPAKSIGEAVSPFPDDPDKAGAALIGCMHQRTRLSKGLDRAGVEIDHMSKEISGPIRDLGSIVWAAQRMVGFHNAAVHFAKSDLRGHAQRAWEAVLRWKKQGGSLAWAAPTPDRQLGSPGDVLTDQSDVSPNDSPQIEATPPVQNCLDHITIEDFAELSGITTGTIQNRPAASRPKPKIKSRGRQKAVYSYADFRSWAIGEFPAYSSRLPEAYQAAMDALANIRRNR
jgi:hypothetical protein